jgi:hypothetical protein
VYEAEEERAAVKAKVVDPAQYLTIDVPLTRSKRKAIEQLCYGRSTVVSDLDGWGFVLNV